MESEPPNCESHQGQIRHYEQGIRNPAFGQQRCCRAENPNYQCDDLMLPIFNTPQFLGVFLVCLEERRGLKLPDVSKSIPKALKVYSSFRLSLQCAYSIAPPDQATTHTI